MKLYPVTGKITLEKQPLGGAVIRFIPTGETLGTGATGWSKPDGAYELEAREGRGAAAGEYRIVISKADPRELLHPNYSDDEKTILTARVPEGGGQIDFPLTRSGKNIR